MNTFNKKNIVVVILVLAAAAVLILWKMPGKETGEVLREIAPHRGTIQQLVTSTATVLPKNRLEIRPPVSGRMESILVKEGETVKKGQTLGWMSSIERAALLDAAQGQGEDKLKYWQDVYKPIALIAPIDGQVIVATIQPGQAVSASESALVLSDKLIVRAQVDETDIGKINVGQKASIILDAYPDKKIPATVEHIYYESTTVNNVTIYNVDILPESVPDFFRSGMNANVDFVVQERDDALLLPQEAVSSDNGQEYVLVYNGGEKTLTQRPVTTGLSEGKSVEILSGLTAADTVVVKSKKFALPKNDLGKNPFMPARTRRSTAPGTKKQ